MKAIFKFNGGALALLCSQCSVIIKVGKDFNSAELEAVKSGKQLPPQFCSEDCKQKHKTDEDYISERHTLNAQRSSN